MRTPSNEYWERRARQRMASYQREAEATIRTITRAYDKAIRDIQDEIVRIFNRFAKDGQMTPEEARRLLNEPMNRSEWEEIKAKIAEIEDPKNRRQLLNRLNAPAYRARITRLQALKEQIYLQCKIIADAEIRASTEGYIGTINEAYYRTMFDIQRGLGVGFEFATMPIQTVETILKNPWSGEHFSSRIWSNTDELARQLNQVITAGFMSGIGVRKMIQEIEERFNVGKHAAARLVRTETTYMANAAEIESYKEAEIEKYIFVATLDLRTSPQCRAHDRKVYNVKDAVPGKNMPPLHPYCRSTTRAYFGPETLQNIQRRARDPVTGKTYLVPADMSYEQWRKNIEEKHSQDRIVALDKQILNKVADYKQYERYKEVLGDDAPKSFESFQNLKYGDSEAWSLVKLDYSRRNRLISNPELKLPNAENATAADEKFTKYLFNPDNKKGWAKGVAFTSRLGYNADNWKELQQEIIKRAAIYPATQKGKNNFGELYEQKMILYGKNRRPANVIVGWIVNENTTRMTSTYIKEVKGNND
ncbi:minor capsid protein [Geobacillus kaustophilus]|nr:minor capsid protein [Geobacillus kaustophilus]